LAHTEESLGTKKLNLKNLWQSFRERLTDRFNLSVIVLIIAYTTILSVYTTSKHNAFDTYAWDLGVYDQSFWSTLNLGKFFWNTPNFGHFHIHFEPVLFLALPIYAVFQNPVTLLVLQSFLIALGAVPLYLIAQDMLKSKARAATFVLLYLTNPVLISINLFDFHAEAFMPLFLFSALYFYRKANFPGFFLFLILALSTKETVPLITVFFGVYIILSRRKSVAQSGLKSLMQDKIFCAGVSTIVLSVVWFYIASQLISFFVLASFHSRFEYTYLHAVWWSDFGKEPLGILVGILTKPSLTLSHLGWMLNEKMLLIGAYLIPLFFMPLFEPWILAIPIPWIMSLFLSSNPWYWRLGIYYPAPVIPFVFLAAVYGIKRASKANLKVVKKIQYLMMISTFFMSVFLIYPYIGLNVPPFRRNLLHNQALFSAIDLIPLSGSVLTQNNLFPHLSHRHQVYPGYPIYITEPTFEYVLMDITNRFYVENVASPMSLYKPIGQVLPDLWNDGSWGVVTAVDGIVLLKRDYTGRLVTLTKEGLMVKFYNNEQFSGEPAFRTVLLSVDWNQTIVGVDWDRTIYTENISPFVTVHDGHYSVAYEGYLTAPSTGAYTFRFVSKNNPSLFIDDKLVLDGSSVTTIDYSAQIQLIEGKHKISIQQIVNGEGQIQLYWQTPLIEQMEIIPTSYLHLQAN